jgi:PAS domain S-box-containing protein
MECSLSAKPLPVPFGSDYLAENWGLDEGFPENSCSGIVLAPDGAMWLGTFRGLVRFNGQRFAPWAPAAVPELKSTSIMSMFKDRGGRIWISTPDGLVMHDRGNWKRWQENEGWGGRADLVRSFAETPDGDLVASRFSGRVFRLGDKGGWQELPTPPGTGGSMCVFDDTGVLHAFRNSFAGALIQGEWHRLAGDPAVQKVAVGAGQTRDGRALIVCQRELLQVRGGAIVARTPLSQPVAIFWCMVEDVEGSLWLPAVGAGAYRIGRDGTVRQLLKADGLPSSGPTRVVYAADDGSVWIGSGVGGLARLRPRRFRHIGESEGLGDHVILTLAPLPDGRVLLTSYGAGMTYFDGKKSVEPLDAGRLGTSLIRSVLSRRDGTIWLGTANNGLLRLDGPNLSPVASGIFGPNETINTLFEDSRGRLWVGSDSRVAVLDRGQFRVVGPLEGGERIGSTMFAEKSDGTVLLARHHKVYAYRTDGLESEPLLRLPEIQQVSTILVDRDDRVWLGTMRHGLHVWQNGEHHVLTDERGLPGDAVSSLVQDDSGRLWFGCNRHVVRADPVALWRAARTAGSQLEIQVFDQSDGLRDLDFPVATQPCVAKDARGRLWFALVRGAAMVDPATLKFETRPPPVVVESISYLPAGATRSVEYLVAEGAANPILPAGSRLIRISYTAFDFQAPRKLRFRVRLGGERGEWQEMRNESTVSFFELPPGRHTLHVQASGSDGAWNRVGATMAFELKPYYWQTQWFRGLAAVGLVALVSGIAWLVARLRIRVARKAAERERRFAEEKEALRRLALLLTESLTLAELGRATAEASRTLLGHDAFMLILARPGETAGYCPYLEDTPVGAKQPEPQHNFTTSVALGLVADGNPLLLNRDDPALAPDPATTERWGCLDRQKTSLMYAPIRWNGRVIGVVSAQSYSLQRYTPHDLNLLQTLGSQCCGAIARLAAEASLQHNEERLRLAMQSARMGPWEIDVNTGTLTASPEAEAVYECTAGTLSGPAANLAERVPAPISAELLQLLEDLRAGRRVALDFRYAIVTAAGAEKWLELKARCQPEPGTDRRARIIGVTADITARRQAEAEREKLEALNWQLQKFASLDRMAGAIAHHFNNQLQAVMLSLEMATSNLPPNAAPVEGLTEAMQSARKAAEVSALMLTYLGQAQGNHEPLDLAEVCQRSLPLLRVTMPQNVVLETDLPSPGPVISADANQLRQVLTNLITNAWEASGDGQRHIRLSVKTVTATDLPATRRFPIDYQPQEKAYACLEVADAGGGIAAEDFDKLFDPFFSTKFIGRGLGLPVVLGIARSHDGVVTVESESSRGSTFRVFIPVSTKAIPQKPILVPVSPITKNVRRGTTVLVVEDEPMVRTTLALVLEHSGFTVLEAEDGVAAVEIFRQHRDEIGCVVCDLTMPRMNGWETLTALRQLVPGIGVILASGYSEAQAMKGDHPERPQAFLHKPYEAKVLINAINQILPHSNA